MLDLFGKGPKADQLLRSGIAKMKAALGPNDPKLADALIDLGTALDGQSRFKDAQATIQDAIRIASRRLPPDDPLVVRAKSALGMVLADSGSYEKAIAVLEPLLKFQSGQESTYAFTALAVSEGQTGQRERAEARANLAVVYDALHQPDKAAKFRTELAANQPH